MNDPACPSSNWETIPTCAGEPRCCCCCSFSALQLTEQHPSGSDAGRSLQEACGGAGHGLRRWGSTGAVSRAVYAGLTLGSGNIRQEMGRPTASLLHGRAQEERALLPPPAAPRAGPAFCLGELSASLSSQRSARTHHHRYASSTWMSRSGWKTHTHTLLSPSIQHWGHQQVPAVSFPAPALHSLAGSTGLTGRSKQWMTAFSSLPGSCSDLNIY